MRFDGTEYAIHRRDGKMLVRVWPSLKTMLNPLWWISCMGLFSLRWLLSRPFVQLAVAAPAVIALLGFLTAINAGGKIAAGTESNTYKRMLLRAQAEKDLPRSRLAIDALIRLNPNQIELVYDRAILEEQAGAHQTAFEIMSGLAISEKSEEAALWLAFKVGDMNQLASWTNDEKRTYYRWLLVAHRNAPEDPYPRRLMGDILRLSGEKQRAYDILLPIADLNADVSYLVCFLQRDLGLKELADVRAEKLLIGFTRDIEGAPEDIATRVKKALLLVQLQREPEAHKLLEDGLVYAQAPEQVAALRTAITEVILSESNRQAMQDRSSNGILKHFQQLKKAMEMDPTNPALVEAVIKACTDASLPESREMLVLREALVQGVDSDTAHFILGTLEINRGNIEAGKQHLELAAKNNPNLPGLLNNLAHALSHEENPDLERALRYSNAALMILPDHPYLRETRGQIYLKLNRYTESIADLEVALEATELRPLVREGLARAYESSGNIEIAQRQRELLKSGR